MLKLIDHQLNRITMYRLILYYLIFLLGAAVSLAFAGVLQTDPYALLFTTAFLLAACSLTNWIFAKAFDVSPNAESVYISALILALIISPLQSYHDLWFLGWVAIWAMASKYMVAIHRQHLFNPVAFAVAVTYFAIDQSASWWVWDARLLPFVLLGGLLLVRKMRRFDLVFSFLLTAAVTMLAFSLLSGDNLVAELQRLVVYSPLFFFAFVILTEPLTTPPTRAWRIGYGALVGFLFVPQIHIGGFYTTPEIAILIGNIFAYLASPKTKLILRLKEKIQIAPGVYDFIFAPDRKFAFAPGQYMEWTLGHVEPDSRGNRRYFTLASAPTEDQLRVGIKFSQNSSTFKQALLAMNRDSEIVAAQLAGDFVLPDDPKQKCVLIAGGIGITPFRSMIQYLLDTRQPRPITLFYANRTVNEIVYQDVFERAQRQLGIKTIYTVTDPRDLPAWWPGKVGRISAELIKAEVPDYQDCVFYISGPQGMVDAFKTLLRQLHVKPAHIKTDFFPGFA
ncbi:MAG: RnfABCDGE type electron transport complex subunit D [Chloroflexi bacterium]|nr:RnfABCDGE type electron transport complex subunit D [Chloroflexota bacterium]